MPRAAAPCLLICALACTRTSNSTPSDPQLDAAAQLVIDGPEIIAVPQHNPPAPDSWRFASDAPQIAARLGRDCGIWDIPTGAFLGTVPDQADDPCEAWADGKLAPSTRVSADGSLEASIKDGRVHVRALADPSSSAVLPCDGCTSVLDLAWAPGEHQLVALSKAPPRIELWDIDTQQRLRSEELQHEDRIANGLVGWNDDGIVAVLEGVTELECEYNYDNHTECELDDDGWAIPPEVPVLSTWFWPMVRPGSWPAAVEQPRRHVGAGLGDARVSPDRRHVFVIQAGTAAHGTDSYALITLGLTGPDSGLSWAIRGGQHSGQYQRERIAARWRGGPTTTWLASFERANYGDGADRFTFGYQVVVLEPEPFGQMQVLFEGDFGGKAKIGLLDIADKRVLVEWDACRRGERLGCTTHEAPLAGCEPVALDPASPTMSLVLAKCSGQLALVEPGRGSADPGRILQRLGSIAPTATHRWGGSWLALLEDTGRLVVVNPSSGRPSFTRESVTGFADVALAAAHDRLAIYAVEQLELLEPRTGASLIRVAKPEGKAGASPDGTKLAAVEGEELLIWSISTGVELERWSLAKLAGDSPCTDVAFRQDGAALLVGSERPLFSVDAKTGQHLGSLGVAGKYLGRNAVDPSWRWLRMHDGSFLRTLDERRLWIGLSEIGLSWAWLDDGQFEGEIDSEPPGATELLYRIGDEHLVRPVYTADDLRLWLKRPGLARDFFGGAQLPAPRIPAAEVAALAAKATRVAK